MPSSPAARSSDLLTDAYDALATVLRSVDEDRSWEPTGCRGWAVRDLTHHLLADAQRALVALHTPVDRPADRDAVTYWQDWAPDPEGSAQGRRHTRVGASMFLVWGQQLGLYGETAQAVVHAGRAGQPQQTVATQGHVLTVEDLLSTLVVEATIHHLDLVVHLPGAAGPTPSGLAETRRVLDGLAGQPVRVGWDDERYARVATGRARPDADEARLLGPVADRFPLFS